MTSPIRRIGFGLAIGTWNIVPFLPMWPWIGGSVNSMFDYIGIFLFLNLPYWSGVLVLWRRGRRHSPVRRALVAEAPGLVQAGFFALFSPWATLFPIAFRAVDGLLLYKFDCRSGSIEAGRGGCDR